MFDLTKKKKAGPDWLKYFFKRYPDLSIRQTEPTSLARTTGFNKVQVDRFFQLLRKIISDCNIAPNKIFSMDETGISTVQKSSKIIAQKEVKQVGKISSAERGKTVTAICCVNSIGCYIPPIFIFSRKRLAPALMSDDTPQGAKGFTPDSEWRDGKRFYKWSVHFQDYVRASLEKKCIIILDNYSSHMYLPAINYARRHGIEFLTIPLHTSHQLQPLDRTFFGPLKTFYSQEVDKCMVNHPGRRITEFEITKLFRAAYERAAAMQNSVSGFQSTRIVPFNPSIFGDSDFAPASVTEIQVEIHEIQEKNKFINVSINNNVELVDSLPQISSSVATTSTSNKDSDSTVDDCNELACPDASKQNDEDQRVFHFFSDVSTLPSAKLTHRKRRAKQAAHKTGSPFKKSITAKVGGIALKKTKIRQKT